MSVENVVRGWIGVDLDGCLAEYHGWEGPGMIGPPVPGMVRVVKDYLDQGYEVRLMTARVSSKASPGEVAVFTWAWSIWSNEVFGVVLPVTAEKDFQMILLYDDRAVGVVHNTGELVGSPQ